VVEGDDVKKKYEFMIKNTIWPVFLDASVKSIEAWRAV
jgi:hypothetical protein